MIFSSLQVLRNSYAHSFDKSNLMSKEIFNIYFLYYFYHEMLTKRLLNVQQHNATLKYIKLFLPKRYKKVTDLDRFLINSFYFITGEWCVITAHILAFTSLKSKNF